MAGLNATASMAEMVHGTNPQFLIEKITRLKIYECDFWKQHCFGLNEETILEKAVDIKYIGGTFGHLGRPTNFLCLVQKLLQLQPDMEIIKEYIEQTDFKYLTALAVFYMRMVGKATDVYTALEPLRTDYRKLRVRKLQGWAILHMDELVDKLLTENLVLDLALPRLPVRSMLVQQRRLPPYISPLQNEFDQSKKRKLKMNGESEGDAEVSEHGHGNEKKISGTDGDKVLDKFFSKKKKPKAEEGEETNPNPNPSSKLHTVGEEVERGTAGSCEKESPEWSVAWWNKRRKLLGLKPLNVPEEAGK